VPLKEKKNLKLPANTFRRNLKLAKSLWGDLSKIAIQQLEKLTADSGLTVLSGDLQMLQGRWYITHAGLLRLARRKRCLSIKTTLVEHFSDPAADRWIFKATVHSSPSRCFVGFGDADPSNVSSTMHGAELRIAETRAVNRALRKAYGIGICSVEELGSFASADPAPKAARDNHQHHNGSNNGQPRLRDQLCILIRQHNLDATLVKAYAADFCGTPTLSGASRELVESFISHLSTAAKENRDGLICKLNSYAQPAQVNQ
jgi:hypothetical protein